MTYRGSAAVPLPEELDKHGLGAVPAIALFDERQAASYIDGWVEARPEARAETRTLARAVLDVLEARGLRLPDALAARVAQCNDAATLGRWLAAAATAADARAFAATVEAQD